MVLSEHLALVAGSVAEQAWPPRDISDVYRLIVSLNLLNASVKQKWGKQVTSYAYIKGMAACAFLWLLYRPMPGVQIYWDGNGKIAYFQLRGQQFSFHFVPLLHLYEQQMREAGLEVLSWDGIKRQLIAADLFAEATGETAVESIAIDADSLRRLRELMVGFCRRQLVDRIEQLPGVPLLGGTSRQRIHTADCGKPSNDIAPQADSQDATQRKRANPPRFDKRHCLDLALKFCPQNYGHFELRRPHDGWKMRVGRFSGFNRQWLVDYLAGNRPEECHTPDIPLEEGKHYYLHRSTWQWRCLTSNRYLLLLSHYNYLVRKSHQYNLCITYGIACYLAALYSGLRFINVLNYSRMTVGYRLYTLHALLSVPPRSKARQLKVWMVVDRQRLLADYDTKSLPEHLYQEYCQTADYRRAFSIIRQGRRVGLVAYSRFHLLPPIYRRIKIYGHYAQVTNTHGKMAVYSLLREAFDSDFIYDKVWFDEKAHSVMGRCGDIEIVIQDIFSERRSEWDWGIRINPIWRLLEGGQRKSSGASSRSERRQVRNS